tara:strand:+ start:13981 stop:14127 length:147 start_codon:yes stop_codon:yes gene_type:complete
MVYIVLQGRASQGFAGQGFAGLGRARGFAGLIVRYIYSVVEQTGVSVL